MRRRRTRAVTPGAALLALAACASSEPLDMALASATGAAEVGVLGGGFVRVDGERVPREAFVLALRQRTRAMSADDRGGFRVVLLVAESAAEDAGADTDWLLDQLQIMGVGQSQVRFQ